MPTGAFDELKRFKMAGFQKQRPFSSFLPGIAGRMGVPLWAFYDGNVTQAARLAKRNRTEFYKLLQRHQLDPKLFKTPK